MIEVTDIKAIAETAAIIAKLVITLKGAIPKKKKRRNKKPPR